MLGRLNAKYDALLDTVINADATFNATVKGFETQIASLKADLSLALDYCQTMEGALDEALAGEDEARGRAEELEETLRLRVEAEYRVLRNLGIDLDSEEEEDVDESVKYTDDPHSVEEEEPLRVEDEVFQGEGDVEVAAVQSPGGSFLAVENTHYEGVKASLALLIGTDVKEEVEVAAELSAESHPVSPQLDTVGTPQLPTAPADPAEDSAGLDGLDSSEAQGSVRDPPCTRVLHTQLRLRRPLGIRRPEWEDLWCGSGEQETPIFTTSDSDAKFLASDVLAEGEVVVAPIHLPITMEAGTDIEVPTETTPIPSQAPTPSPPACEDTNDRAIDRPRPHDPNATRFRRMMRDPPQARVLYTPLYSRRPLGIRRPEWVDTVLADGEQEAAAFRLVDGVSQPFPPSQTYPRGILNAKGGLWEAPVHTTSRVTWSHEERMFYFPGDEPEVIACTDSEKHDVA